MARRRKLEKDIRVPLEYGLDLLCGRWNSRVIGALAGGVTKRYGEIRAEIDGISDTSLALTLQELEEGEMITRTEVVSGKRTFVEYRLTEKGEDAVPILRSICAWAVRYHSSLTETALDKCKSCPIVCDMHENTCSADS